MTVLSITCDNCGAKYKLPETFTGTQAKCQKCGSVIDVGKQRAAAGSASSASTASAPAAAAKPMAAAKPAAAARPAVDRSKSEPKPPERPTRSVRPERPAKETDSAAPEEGKDRRGARGERPAKNERPAKKANSAMPLMLSGIGLVALIAVAVVFLKGGGDKDKSKTEATAQNSPAPQAPPTKPAENPAAAAAAAPAEQPAAKAATPAAAPDADKPADKPAEKPAEGKPADASTPPAEAPPVDADPTRPKRPWEKVKGINSMADVTDPKTYAEVVWPASADDAKKAEIRGFCDDVENGGNPGNRAKPKLAAIGYEALFGIVEKLRALDYKSESGNALGFEFNKLLEEMTGGLNTGFELVDVGEPIDPRKAEYNTRTVKAWRSMLDKIPDAETFKKERAARLKKQADTDK